MSLQLAPSRDPGLQSVLESGLALIRQEAVEDSRRERTLDALSQMLSEANRGSQALGAQNFLLAVDDQPALESISLFLNYLSEPLGDELPNRLREAAAVVDDLRAGHVASSDVQARVCDVIEKLLAGLKSDFNTTPLASERSFSLSY